MDNGFRADMPDRQLARDIREHCDMPETRSCGLCYREILKSEYDENGGICNVCYGEAEEERGKNG